MMDDENTLGRENALNYFLGVVFLDMPSEPKKEKQVTPSQELERKKKLGWEDENSEFGFRSW